MKCSRIWLEEWIGISLTTAELVQSLTMAGLEVESVEKVIAPFDHVVVGEVLSVEPHPNADRLYVCRVDVGKEILTIVCGATNVRKGLKVPTALLKSHLPHCTIEKVTLRGVHSNGMMCSEKDLGISEIHGGLIELPQDAKVGLDIREYAHFDDDIIDINLTPNRGDCASILGVAREIAAITKKSLKKFPIFPAVKAQLSHSLPVKVKAKEACPRYLGRLISHINIKATTPFWMKEKLRRCGFNSINAVVDVTNYVLLELGQPLHAFDAGKLHSGIIVSMAKEQETLELLNDQKINLNPHLLIISDEKRPLALAGIMGGKDSAISDNTDAIFLESAFFQPESISGKARIYGLQTEASFRFERGVDFQLPKDAMEYATQLLLNIVGGEAGPIVDVTYAEYLPSEPSILLRIKRVEQLLGQKISKKEIRNILKRLNMKVRSVTQGFFVSPPSYRFDINLEVDLIEEIARLYGYNHINNKPYLLSMEGSPIDLWENGNQALRDFFKNRSYHEIISYTFIDPQDQKLFDRDQNALVLSNPIAENMSVMRTNLWPGLVNALVYNIHHQQTKVRLFEKGLRFIQSGQNLLQQEVLSGLLFGESHERQWNEEQRDVDFFDIKGDLEALCDYIFHVKIEWRGTMHPALALGQTLGIYQKEHLLGYMGALHPSILNVKGINRPVYIFELLLESLILSTPARQFKVISKFPVIRRDISITVQKKVSAHQIEQTIRDELVGYLLDMEIFDLYEGESIERDKKSIALSLFLHHMTHTLNDKEISEKMNQVYQVLYSHYGATLRK